jgi:phage shock protein E
MLFNLLKRILTAAFLAMAIVPIAQAEEKIGTVAENGVRHVDAMQAKTVISTTPDIVILDVRTPKEFKAGHIKGAINIDYYADDFKEQIALLDEAANYLLHCRTGRRSGKSVPIMIEAGIQNISHLDGGIESWKAAGLPVTSN